LDSKIGQLIEAVRNSKNSRMIALRLVIGPYDDKFNECADAVRADHWMTGNQRRISYRKFLSIVATHLLTQIFTAPRKPLAETPLHPPASAART
jgi:hypothetical protein